MGLGAVRAEPFDGAGDAADESEVRFGEVAVNVVGQAVSGGREEGAVEGREAGEAGPEVDADEEDAVAAEVRAADAGPAAVDARAIEARAVGANPLDGAVRAGEQHGGAL